MWREEDRSMLQEDGNFFVCRPTTTVEGRGERGRDQLTRKGRGRRRCALFALRQALGKTRCNKPRLVLLLENKKGKGKRKKKGDDDNKTNNFLYGQRARLRNLRKQFEQRASEVLGRTRLDSRHRLKW